MRVRSSARRSASEKLAVACNSPSVKLWRTEYFRKARASGLFLWIVDWAESGGLDLQLQEGRGLTSCHRASPVASVGVDSCFAPSKRAKHLAASSTPAEGRARPILEDVLGDRRFATIPPNLPKNGVRVNFGRDCPIASKIDSDPILDWQNVSLTGSAVWRGFATDQLSPFPPTPIVRISVDSSQGPDAVVTAEQQ